MEQIRSHAHILFGVFLLLLALSIYSLSSFFVDHQLRTEVETVVALIDDGLYADTEYLLRQAEELNANQTFDRHIRSGDITQLLSSVVSERDRRNLDGLLITDANGLVLTRSNAVQLRGDFVYHTTAWGYELSRGRTVTSVEAGAAFPLDVLGAVPMNRGDETIGSIVAAYIVDDAYAARFRNTYLPSGAEIAFQVPGKGIVGHSFDNEAYGRILGFYFSEGSDALLGSSTATHVAFNGDQYLVRSVFLSGVQESPGSVLVFVPAYTFFEQSVAATAALFIFFALAAFALPQRRRWGGIRVTLIIAVIGGVCVFAAVYFAYGSHIENRAVQLTRPTYAIYNSTMELDPPVAALSQQSEYRVGVRIYSGGEAINATEVRLNFDPSRVQVSELDFSRSFCNQSLIIQRDIDNETGSVRIVCGVPNPGFSERSGIVADLFVQPIAEGTFELAFAEGTRVLANDGLGTQVLRYAVDGSYVAVEQLQTNGAQESELLIFSPTHPNPERWYSRESVVFTWTKRNAEDLGYHLSDSISVPEEMSTVPADSIELRMPGSGVHYFHLKDQSGDVSELKRFKVKVDAEPPRPPRVQVSNDSPRIGELIRLAFSGEDTLSGLQSNFYIQFNDGIFFPVGETFSTTFFEPGPQTITVRSFDLANNHRDTTVTLNVQSRMGAALSSLFADASEKVWR